MASPVRLLRMELYSVPCNELDRRADVEGGEVSRSRKDWDQFVAIEAHRAKMTPPNKPMKLAEAFGTRSLSARR